VARIDELSKHAVQRPFANQPMVNGSTLALNRW
jgi:hypothetical protein